MESPTKEIVFDAVVVMPSGYLPSNPKDFEKMNSFLKGIDLQTNKQIMINQNKDCNESTYVKKIEKELSSILACKTLQLCGKFYGTTSSDYYYQVYCNQALQVQIKNVKKNHLISYCLRKPIYDESVLVRLPHRKSNIKIAPKFSKQRLLLDIAHSHRSNGCNGWKKPI